MQHLALPECVIFFSFVLRVAQGAARARGKEEIP
jgi:hypothetical protein